MILNLFNTAEFRNELLIYYDIHKSEDIPKITRIKLIRAENTVSLHSLTTIVSLGSLCLFFQTQTSNCIWGFMQVLNPLNSMAPGPLLVCLPALTLPAGALLSPVHPETL